MVGAARQHPVQRLHFGHGEDDIGRNADDQTFGRDSLQRRCHASALVADVVRVESVEDLVIGVGIITPAELFLLGTAGRCRPGERRSRRSRPAARGRSLPAPGKRAA